MKLVIALFAVIAALAVCHVDAAQFTAIKPGGDTICSKGGEYAFFVRPGTVNKLLIFFEGGGACWDAISCALPIYTESVDIEGELANLNSADSGIHTTNPKNPYWNWTHVFIPYCSADVHTGNQTKDFGLYSIHFKGRVNTQAALDYAFSKYPKPDTVATFGCSAGSIGAFINAPYVMNHYKDSINYQWGDSEVGVLSEDQWNGAWENWNLQLAPFIPGLAKEHTRNWTSTINAYVLEQSAAYFPKSTWVAYTSNADIVQTTYYDLGGGKGKWTDLMRADLKYVSKTKNFATFIAPGDHHCVDGGNGWYDVTSNGVNLVDWLGSITSGGSYQQHVDCTPNC